MPYTYLGDKAYTNLTGNERIDKSWQTLKKVTGWDYRVSMFIEITGWLWWKRRTEVFTIFVPCGQTAFGGEFGIMDFNARMMFHAPEPIALAYLEALYWGALDERQRVSTMTNQLLAQSTHRLGEIQRLEGAMEETKNLLRRMWPYYWGPENETLRPKARELVGD